MENFDPFTDSSFSQFSTLANPVDSLSTMSQICPFLSTAPTLGQATVIPLSPGLPAPSLFPFSLLRPGARAILSNYSHVTLLLYSKPSNGFSFHLKENPVPSCGAVQAPHDLTSFTFLISPPTTFFLTHFTLVTMTSWLFLNKLGVFLNHLGSRCSNK